MAGQYTLSVIANTFAVIVDTPTILVIINKEFLVVFFGWELSNNCVLKLPLALQACFN